MIKLQVFIDVVNVKVNLKPQLILLIKHLIITFKPEPKPIFKKAIITPPSIPKENITTGKSSGCLGQIVSLFIFVMAAGFFLTQCSPFTCMSLIDDYSETSEATKPVVTEPLPESVTTIEPEKQSSETTELVKSIEPEEESESLISCQFAWDYGIHGYTWEINIPEKTYQYFKGLPRPNTQNYSIYVANPLDDLYIEAIVEKLEAVCSDNGFSEYQTVEMVIAFVQSLPYTYDSVSTPYDEYPRYPLETLVDNGGDCEDSSILLASLLDKMGYGVVLVSFPNHIAIGIKGGENIQGSYYTHEDEKYYYLESTNTGWKIGQIPDEYKETSATIYSLKPVPIITHDWEVSVSLFTSSIDLTVTVENLGTATAKDVYIYAGFDLGDGTGWSLKESDKFDLASGYKVTSTLPLIPPPPGVHTRLMVWIVMEDIKVEESYSIWIDV
jgi:hypothetical protein